MFKILYYISNNIIKFKSKIYYYKAPVGKAKKQPKVQMKGLMWNALK